MNLIRIVRNRNIKFVVFWFTIFLVLKIMMLLLSYKDADIIRRYGQTTIKRIDYHDYAQMESDLTRSGPGEQGLPVVLSLTNNNSRIKLHKLNGIDVLLSDHIALNRSLPDVRHPKCKRKKYLLHLPSVSVIIPVFNEHSSTMLRSIHSIVNRSPRRLLKEIIIGNDGSLTEFMKKELPDYVTKNFPRGLVKIVRLKKREGLIRARLEAAKIAEGDVLIFLDSHVEVNVNWLPPLLEPIVMNYRTAVCPLVDIISHSTFQYIAQDNGMRGAFNWEFHYKRLPLPKWDLQGLPSPFATPVMAGGLFAISQNFFWELGGYDPELQIWGGEQFELSFKIWQCGGQLLEVPCSRVGHIYRGYIPFADVKLDRGDFIARNYRRIAEVWMDEFAQYIYQHYPNCLTVDPGNLSERKIIRERLNCKSFRWYMDNVAYDLTEYFPPVEPACLMMGKIRPVWNLSLCVDANNGEQMDHIILRPCEEAVEKDFRLTWKMEFITNTRSMCWDIGDGKNGSPLLLYQCHSSGGNQQWRYNLKSKQIQHVFSGKCVDSHKDSPNSTTALFIEFCLEEAPSQKWDLENIAVKMGKSWEYRLQKNDD